MDGSIEFKINHSIQMLEQKSIPEVSRHLNKDKTGQVAETLFTGLASKKTWNTNKDLCAKALSLLPKSNPKFAQQRSQFVKVLVHAGLFKKSNEVITKNILKTACDQNDRELLKDMLDQGVLDCFPNEVLPLVCEHGNLEMVELVLEGIAKKSTRWSNFFGTEINCKNSAGQFPLTIACERGHTNMVKLLLQHGADINEDGPSFRDLSRPPEGFRKACEKGHLRIAKLLIPGMIDLSLHAVIESDATAGQPELLKAILAQMGPLDKGWNFFAKNASKKALERALEREDHESAQILLDYGARITFANFPQAVTHAASTGNLKLVQSLLETDRDRKGFILGEAIVKAIEHRNLLMVQALLEHGATIDRYVDFFSRAAATGDVEMVTYIFDHMPGIDNVWRSRALSTAVKNNDLPMAKLLLERGGVPILPDVSRQEYLAVACQNNNYALAELLLNHGLDVKDGRTALWFSCKNHNLALVQLLFDHHVPLEWDFVYGCIICNPDSEILEFVNTLAIEGEVDPKVKDCLIAIKNKDASAFQAALAQGEIESSKIGKIAAYGAIHGDPQIMEFLYSHFPNLAELGEDRKLTQLTLAAGTDNLEVVKWFINSEIQSPESIQNGLQVILDDPTSGSIISINLLKAGAVPSPATLERYLNDEAVIALFIQHHLVLDLHDTEGNTLLDLASQQKNDNRIVQLIEAGMDAEIAIKHGYTPEALALLRICGRGSVNQQQLSNVGMAAVVIPQAPPSANRKDLFTLATRLEKKYRGNYSRGITKMCDHIDGNKPYSGVPGNIAQRTAWYAVLNNYLKLISVELPKHSEDVQKDVLVQLNVASNDCGGAWMDECNTQYLRLIGQADVLVNLEDPAVMVHTMLADFKKQALAQLNLSYVSQGYADERHVNLFLQKEVGPLLGIAGDETKVEDVYSPERLKQRPLMDDLSEFYNPIDMTKWLDEELPQRLSMRKVGEKFGPFLQDWVEQNMDQVAHLLSKAPQAFEEEYDQSPSWVAESCFNSLDSKVNPGSLSTVGTFLLLNAAGALAPKAPR